MLVTVSGKGTSAVPWECRHIHDLPPLSLRARSLPVKDIEEPPSLIMYERSQRDGQEHLQDSNPLQCSESCQIKSYVHQCLVPKGCKQHPGTAAIELRNGV